jgi:cytochrome b561
VQDQSVPEYITAITALVKLADAFKLPTVITTSAADGPNGPVLSVITQTLPEAPGSADRGPKRPRAPAIGVWKMSMLSSRSRYGAVEQLFHWLTVVLVGTAYIVSPGGSEDRVYSVAFDFTRQTHETIGITVFGLVLLRILWRLVDPTPEAEPMAPWMKYSASAAHLGLYALLLAIPLTAVAGAWLDAHPLTIFGIGTVGPMLPPVHDLGQTIAYVHTILGNVIIWLAGFHAAAALFHHLVLRDNVLNSMLPDGWRLPGPDPSADQIPQ